MQSICGMVIHTNSVLEACTRKCGRKFAYIIKSGMNPHRDIRNGDDAMTTLEQQKKKKM
jgi:hypothetical protein